MEAKPKDDIDLTSEGVMLNSGETVLFKSRFSLIKFIPRWVVTLSICALMIGIAGHAQINGAQHGWSPTLIRVVSLMAGAIGIAAFGVFLFAFLLYRHQFLILTDSRLTITWIWNLRTQNWVLRNITNINKDRPVLGIIFGYGTLRVQDSDGELTTFRFVPRVDVLESALARASMRQNVVRQTKGVTS